jgi:methyl coenzyme M reductase beta subunit
VFFSGKCENITQKNPLFLIDSLKKIFNVYGSLFNVYGSYGMLKIVKENIDDIEPMTEVLDKIKIRFEEYNKVSIKDVEAARKELKQVNPANYMHSLARMESNIQTQNIARLEKIIKAYNINIFKTSIVLPIKGSSDKLPPGTNYMWDGDSDHWIYQSGINYYKSKLKY